MLYFLGQDMAPSRRLAQKPCVVGVDSERMGVPGDPLLRNEFADLRLDRDPECLPSEARSSFEVRPLVSLRYGGVQPANTSRLEMFGPGAPVWDFPTKPRCSRPVAAPSRSAQRSAGPGARSSSTASGASANDGLPAPPPQRKKAGDDQVCSDALVTSVEPLDTPIYPYLSPSPHAGPLDIIAEETCAPAPLTLNRHRQRRRIYTRYMALSFSQFMRAATEDP